MWVGNVPWLIGVAAIASGFSLAFGETATLPGLCGSLNAAAFTNVVDTFLLTWSPPAIVASWVLMVMAMMPPLLSGPIEHVRMSTLVSRRPRAVVLFLTGYVAMWLAAGLFLIPASALIGLAASERWGALACFVLALAWSGSPSAQTARNRCHRIQRIDVFGRSADRSCCVFGTTNGLACISVCWPWMLATMTTGFMHVVIMTAVAVLLFLERLMPSRHVSWQRPPLFSIAMSLLHIKTWKVVGRSVLPGPSSPRSFR